MPEDLLSQNQVFYFVTKNIFEDTLSKDHLLKFLFQSCNQYKTEVIKSGIICLTKFQQGFDLQKGAIFGFGSTSNENIGLVLKISDVVDMSSLSKAPIQNSSGERSVGLLNYEINIKGKVHFRTGSQNIVINKYGTLLKGLLISIRV